MAGFIARLQAISDSFWDFFGLFRYPRVAAFIFEGAILGTIGWLLILLGRFGQTFDIAGRIALFIGGLTFIFGVFAYIVLWVNEKLQERFSET